MMISKKAYGQLGTKQSRNVHFFRIHQPPYVIIIPCEQAMNIGMLIITFYCIFKTIPNMKTQSCFYYYRVRFCSKFWCSHWSVYLNIIHTSVKSFSYNSHLNDLNIFWYIVLDYFLNSATYALLPNPHVYSILPRIWNFLFEKMKRDAPYFSLWPNELYRFVH